MISLSNLVTNNQMWQKYCILTDVKQYVTILNQKFPSLKQNCDRIALTPQILRQCEFVWTEFLYSYCILHCEDEVNRAIYYIY
jgi:hypothetical protein